VALLLALLSLVFNGYFLGRTTPNWDFYSIYLSGPYAWWSLGGPFNARGWVPYVFNGYPGASAFQNGSWFLPIGAAQALVPYTTNVAATVQWLLVCFGALGAYLLARSLPLPRSISMVVLTAYFFAPGFFGGAQMADQVRGWSLLPWVVLATSPRWPWGRWYAVPGAALLLFQFAVGAYPGQLVAAAYLIPCVTVAWLMQGRDRPWLRGLVTSALSGALLSALKFVPALPFLGVIGKSNAEPGFSWDLLAGFFIDYRGLSAPINTSFVSSFLPLLVLCAIPFAGRGSAATRVGVALSVPSLALAFPGSPLARMNWPGASLSQNHVSDFRAFWYLGLLILGAAGLARLRDTNSRRTRVWLTTVVTLMAIVVTVFALWRPGRWATVGAILNIGSALVLLLIAWLESGHRRRALPILALVGATGLACASVQAGYQVPWNVPRSEVETAALGALSTDLVARAAPMVVERRPERRLSPGADLMEMLTPDGDAAVFDRSYASYGYVNPRNYPSFARLAASRGTVEGRALYDSFYGAPSGLLPVGPGSSLNPEGLRPPCAEEGVCPDWTFRSVRYAPGELSFAVEVHREAAAVVNESYFPGWTARSCPSGGSSCVDLAVTRGPLEAPMVSLPEGAQNVTFRYDQPLRTQSLLIGGVGLLIGAWTTLAAGARSFRRRALRLSA
jgi:hypothetical protein